MITLDFETRSRVDLVEAGLYRYAADPSTEVLCAAFRFDSDISVHLDSDKKALTELRRRILSGEQICAFNAEFEWQILRNVWRIPVPAKQMYCAMARAMMCGIPASLEGAGEALGVSILKDTEGARLMRKMCKSDKFGNFFWDEASQARLEQYCIQDVLAEYACEQKLPHLPPKELEVYHLTLEMNAKGVLVDTKTCRIAVDLLAEHEKTINARIAAETSGAVRTGKQVAAMLKELNKAGLKIEDLGKDAVAAELSRTDISPQARHLLELRAEGSKSSGAKYQKILDSVSVDNRVRGTLKYHGATTGRYAGAGIQPQNFPRPKIKNTNLIADVMRVGDYELFAACYKSPATAASAALRGMLIAEHEFFDGDYSSIEARVLAWLAEDESELTSYRMGFDNYIAMARKIYKIPAQQVSDEKRQLGKQAVLGAGFGMGWERFMITCQSYGMKVDEKLAKLAVDAYRESHPKVKQLWWDCDKAFKSAIQNKGMTFVVGKLKFIFDGYFLKLRLPSGRNLWFYKPTLVRNIERPGQFDATYKTAYHGKLVTERTYGGHIVQQATQATARDIMVEAMLRLAKIGMIPVLTIHDEILVDCPDSDRYSEFQKVMEVPPEWGLDIPLKVGAWKGKRFRK